MIHVDLLRVSEIHEGDVPEFGEMHVMKSLKETGELVVDTLTGQQVEGSYGVTLRVRSVGGRVEVSGNPSKWGRMDAVTGVRSVEEALCVYDRVLRLLGLPPFSRRNFVVTLANGDKVKRGPIISRIDLTRNIVTGGPSQLSQYCSFLESQYWGQRTKCDRRGPLSLSWGGLGRRQLAMYSKADEVRANKGEILRRIPNEAKQPVIQYLDKLSEWAELNGILREEVRLGRRYLFEQEWTQAQVWLGKNLAEFMPETVREKSSGGATVTDWKTEVFARVLQETGSVRQAKTARDMLLAWMAGADIQEGISYATFMRYAKMLRDLCSVDVRKPCNVQAISTRVRVVEVEARVLEESDLPHWYIKAA